MIFVTLGSQKFQFNRLLIALDKQIADGKICEPIYAQIGASDYRPRNYEYKDFLDRDEFAGLMERSEIVITHGGTGAIIGAVKKEKKVIAIPRLAKYGEHVDDHQLQLIRQFRNLDLICECQDCNEIWKAIREVREKDYKKYQSNTKTIIDSIERYIKNSNG